MKKIRLQAYLAQCGLGSRRKCEEFITQGDVSIDGFVITTLGTKISGNERIECKGIPVLPEKKIYLAVHKPVGYLCSSYDPEGRPLVKDFFSQAISQRLFHVGRLDFLSSGLIFYTNDGDFANIVSHPSFEIEKDYQVHTLTPVSNNILETFKNGIVIDSVNYKLKNYTQINRHSVHLTLLEGKNREIRRFFKHFQIGIKTIHRTRIGIVNLDGIAPGKYKQFSDRELAWFFQKK